MKKLLVIVLAVVMLLAFTACDEKKPQATPSASAQTSVDPSEEPSQGSSVEPEGSENPSQGSSVEPEGSENPSQSSSTEPNNTLPADNSSDPATVAPTSSAAPVITPAPAQTQGATEAPGDNTVAPEPTDMPGIKGVVKYGIDTEMRFSFVDKGHGKGTLRVDTLMYAPEDQIEAMGYKAPLALVDIKVFDVEVTNNNGKYVVIGGISAVGMNFEGDAEAVEFFRQSMIASNNGDSELDKLTVRALQGEILTGEDIENFTWKTNEKIDANFEITGDKLTVTAFASEYTEWGTMDELAITFGIQDGAIRKEIVNNRGKLENIIYYRENGSREKEESYSEGIISAIDYYNADNMILKTEYYDNGTITGTIEYDENGDPINPGPIEP